MGNIRTYQQYTDLQSAVHECVKDWAVGGYDNELQRISDFEDMAGGGGNIDTLVETMIEFLVKKTCYTEEYLEENKEQVRLYMAEQAKIEMPYIMNAE